jgi:UDP-N-acetylmuramyl pentapeptide phosphotransferase/UDP-N-acetylglucosamine-1-phosphate transferase
MLGVWIVPLFVLAVVSTGNAVNISDGLDGLAGGLLSVAYMVLHDCATSGPPHDCWLLLYRGRRTPQLPMV